eukprot:TRINITY_DN88074_c0_g1_i1.p1 TRINITY_DN88074_c0_g1~~TRINITY_DN88074_c0_g1_i1.p1  ORF type:complete len:558 (-),score=76.36 TRINITY_DN88074_c0_g1_i1:201-1835(-)
MEPSSTLPPASSPVAAENSSATVDESRTTVCKTGRPSAGGAADAYYTGTGNVCKIKRSQSERELLREQLTPNSLGLVVVMVGLPARGKSFISRKVERFLRWTGASTRSFNVGMYRRDAVDPSRSGRSDFFNTQNSCAMAARDRVALLALEDALKFLDEGGKFAILDATNSTTSRRQLLAEKVDLHHRRYGMIFVETICSDPEVLVANMLTKVRFSPDFANMSEEDALADLRARITNYDAAYETVKDSEGAYIKLFDMSSKIMANHCYGRVAKSILPYLMAIHIGSRPIWLVRAGAGERPKAPQANHDRISQLSAEGRKFAADLGEFVQQRAKRYWDDADKPVEDTYVLTSTMNRAVSTAQFAGLEFERRATLNPIDKGVLGDGWWDVECSWEVPPWEEVEQRHPVFMTQWRQNPLTCQFPGGESYKDVLIRLESLLIDVEMCTRPVLIVSHVTILQLLIAYFKGLPVEDVWKLPVAKNVLFEVIPTSGGSFQHEEHNLDACRESKLRPNSSGNDAPVLVCVDKRLREGSCTPDLECTQSSKRAR